MEMSEFAWILEVVDFLLGGLPILLMVFLLPVSIYDRERGEFKGFFRPLPLFWIAVSALAAWRGVETSPSSTFEPWKFAAIMVSITILAARITVKELHRHFHGEWLHKQGVWLLKKSREI